MSAPSARTAATPDAAPDAVLEPFVELLRAERDSLPGASAAQVHAMADRLARALAALPRPTLIARTSPQDLRRVRQLLEQHAELVRRAQLGVERGLEAFGLCGGHSPGTPDRFRPLASGGALRPDLRA